MEQIGFPPCIVRSDGDRDHAPGFREVSLLHEQCHGGQELIEAGHPLKFIWKASNRPHAENAAYPRPLALESPVGPSRSAVGVLLRAAMARCHGNRPENYGCRMSACPIFEQVNQLVCP